MWFSMYKVAKYNPQITTAWAATNYLAGRLGHGARPLHRGGRRALPLPA